MMKIKILKLAESMRITPSNEEKFIDFGNPRFKDVNAYYHDGLVYIINTITKECTCTSMANIRQMTVEDHDIHYLTNPKRNGKKNQSDSESNPEIVGISQTESGN